MIPLLVSVVVTIVVSLVISLLVIKFGRPRGSLLSHHPHRCHCQDELSMKSQELRSLFLEWLRDGKLSPFCRQCSHFLQTSEPRMVSQPIVYPCDSPTMPLKFTESYRSSTVCNECFYTTAGTPSNFHPCGKETLNHV